MINIKKIFSSLSVLLLATSMLLVVAMALLPSSVSALPTQSEIENSTLRWITRGIISLQAGDETFTFIDNNPFDNDYNYRIQNYRGYGQIDLVNGFDLVGAQGAPSPWIVGRLDMDYLPTETATVGSDTDPNEINKNISDAQNARIIMVVDPNNPDRITRIDGNGSFSFTRVNETLFSRDSEEGSTCQDVIVVDGNSLTVYELDSSGTGTFFSPAEAGDPNCNVDDINFRIDYSRYPEDSKAAYYDDDGNFLISRARVPFSSDPSSEQSTTTNEAGGVSGSGTNPEDQPNCTNGGGELSWIVCPLLGYADDVISYLDNQINTLLQVPEGYYNDPTIEQIWQRMRDIAYLLLIPTLLIMVIGTALGFQFLDAYTVKRALPRLFVAVIFIAISLPVLRFLIGSVNLVGQGVYGLITSVVSPDFDFSLEGLFDPNFATGGVVTLALGGAVLTAKIWIVAGLFLAFSVFLSIATIFLLLAFRQLLIVALIIIAPLAILAWIFPGNDKPWKLWWGSFWKLLILYPLIMGLLAIGRVFAYVIDGVSPGGLAEVVLKLVAYIGPFFLVPSAFKYAGGVFANIGGIVNNKEKGMFDRLRKARGQSLAQGGKDAMQGNLFKGGGEKSFRQKYNRAIQYGANQKAGGLAIRPATRNARVRSSINDHELEHALEGAEKLPGAKAFFQSDDAMEGTLLGDGDRQKMMQYYRSKGYSEDQARLSTEKGLAMRSQMGAQAFNLAALAKLPATGTYATEENLGQWHQSIVKATHGDKNLQASIVAMGKGGFRNAQRYEASEAGFGDHFAALEMAEKGASAAEISTFIHDKSYKAGGPQAVIGSRNDKVARMFAGAINRDMNTADNAYNIAEANLGDAQKALSAETDQTKIPTLQANVENLAKTRDAAYTEKMRSRAAVDQIHDSVGQSKQVVSGVLADEVFAKEVEFETTRLTKTPDGDVKRVKERVKSNRVEEINSYHDDKIFQESKHVYGQTAEEQERRALQGGEPPAPGEGFGPPKLPGSQ